MNVNDDECDDGDDVDAGNDLMVLLMMLLMMMM